MRHQPTVRGSAVSLSYYNAPDCAADPCLNLTAAGIPGCSVASSAVSRVADDLPGEPDEEDRGADGRRAAEPVVGREHVVLAEVVGVLVAGAREFHCRVLLCRG